jgi:glucose-1-phosphate thymidylyltransferase
MEIAKALILADCGREDRDWPIPSAMPRQLFPVGNCPILFHNLESLRAGGLLEAVILADTDRCRALRDAVGDGSEWELSVRCAEWDASGGLASALSASDDFLAGEPVLVAEGDALLREKMHSHISRFARERLDALALRLARPAAEATPGYLLSPRAVSILRETADEVADPLTGVEARGGRVSVQPVDGCLPCHGNLDTLLESNRRVLEALPAAVAAETLEESQIHGRVNVHPTARIRRSLLRGPAIIGPGARVTDSYVGPYTSIGASVALEGTEIEHSIVLPEAELRFVGTRLESSVIGRGARVSRGFTLPGAIRMSIGDGAEIVLR